MNMRRNRFRVVEIAFFVLFATYSAADGQMIGLEKKAAPKVEKRSTGSPLPGDPRTPIVMPSIGKILRITGREADVGLAAGHGLHEGDELQFRRASQPEKTIGRIGVVSVDQLKAVVRIIEGDAKVGDVVAHFPNEFTGPTGHRRELKAPPRAVKPGDDVKLLIGSQANIRILNRKGKGLSEIESAVVRILDMESKSLQEISGLLIERVVVDKGIVQEHLDSGQVDGLLVQGVIYVPDTKTGFLMEPAAINQRDKNLNLNLNHIDALKRAEVAAKYLAKRRVEARYKQDSRLAVLQPRFNRLMSESMKRAPITFVNETNEIIIVYAKAIKDEEGDRLSLWRSPGVLEAFFAPARLFWYTEAAFRLLESFKGEVPPPIIPLWPDQKWEYKKVGDPILSSHIEFNVDSQIVENLLASTSTRSNIIFNPRFQMGSDRTRTHDDFSKPFLVKLTRDDLHPKIHYDAILLANKGGKFANTLGDVGDVMIDQAVQHAAGCPSHNVITTLSLATYTQCQGGCGTKVAKGIRTGVLQLRSLSNQPVKARVRLAPVTNDLVHNTLAAAFGEISVDLPPESTCRVFVEVDVRRLPKNVEVIGLSLISTE